MASYGHYGQCAARVGPDHICQIQLPISSSAVFPQKAWTILHKTLIWMAWSDLGQTHLVQKQASVQESSSPVSGRMQPAHYQFPTFRLSCVLPQMAQIILCKTRLDLIWFWLTVRFWPNGSSPEAIWCASIIQPASSQWQCFQAHPDRMFYAKPGWIQFGSG